MANLVIVSKKRETGRFTETEEANREKKQNETINGPIEKDRYQVVYPRTETRSFTLRHIPGYST